MAIRLGRTGRLESLIHAAALDAPAESAAQRLLSDERFLFACARLQQAEAARTKTPAEPAGAPGAAVEPDPANRFAEQGLSLLRESGPVARPAGLSLEAYLSPVDLAVVPYVVFRPKAPAPAAGRPLAVVLHSYWPDLAADDFFYPIPGLLDVLEAEGWMGLWPYGRTNTDFVGPGERDVLDATARVFATDKVDPSRVALMGYSMGGSGAWTIAARRPSAFAGVFVLAGRTDFYAWRGVDEKEVPRWKRLLIDLDFAREEAANFLALPVRAVYGSLDTVIPPSQGRALCDSIRALGGSAEFSVVPGGTHWTLGVPATMDPAFPAWLRRLARPRAPPAFSHRFLTPSEGESYGVAAEGVERFGEPARILGSRAPGGILSLELENVSRLRVFPGALGGARGRIRIGGRETELSVPPEGALVSPRGELLPEGDPAAAEKRPGLSGPFRDVLSGPFVLVYGTRGTEGETRKNREMAEREAKMWRAYAKADAPVRSDAEASSGILAARSAICFGTPQTHALLAGLSARLPVLFTPDGVSVGRRTFRWADGVGLRMCIPHPGHPGRYLAICAGAPWGEHLPENHKWDLLPDLIVYGPEKNEDGTNRARLAGFFDASWRLDEKALEADPEPPPPTAPPGP